MGNEDRRKAKAKRRLVLFSASYSHEMSSSAVCAVMRSIWLQVYYRGQGTGHCTADLSFK